LSSVKKPTSRSPISARGLFQYCLWRRFIEQGAWPVALASGDHDCAAYLLRMIGHQRVRAPLSVGMAGNDGGANFGIDQCCISRFLLESVIQRRG